MNTNFLSLLPGNELLFGAAGEALTMFDNAQIKNICILEHKNELVYIGIFICLISPSIF
jgi:hypothetical protein